MPRILVIDDDRIIRKVIETSLQTIGYEVITAESGEEGLRRIKAIQPDVVITDKMMPGIDGFELTRRLRREPEFAHIPILVLTGESELEDKLAAFEAGADDYLSKPFESAELAARLTALLRRSKALQAAQLHNAEPTDNAHFIALHTLRGGIGASSLATNLAICLRNLWKGSTLLTDAVLPSGQLALMLNKPLKHTWANLAHFDMSDLDLSSITGILGKHESGLHFIAAPNNPEEAEKVTAELITQTLNLLRPRYKYIVSDIPHNFSEVSIEILDMANTILLLLAPEMSAIRSAAIALDTYEKLGFGKDKVKLVLNWTFEQGGLASKKIESALQYPISFVIPFAPTRFVSAINRGIPFVVSQPEDPVSALLEDFSFRLSKESDQMIPPASPSSAWHRVNGRLHIGANNQKKGKSRLLFA
jgi:pilus assembly protein CpaE